VSDPWADPATPTQPGGPYTGPPPTAPQPWTPAPTPYAGGPGYGWPPGYSGHPPAWGWPPPRPRKPGQVIGAAVLAFVQAAVALIGTLYTYMLSALAGLSVDQGGFAGLAGLASEGTTLAVVQLLSVVPLVAGGILVLNRRSRAAWLTLAVALVVQVLIALYWTLRLSGAIGDGFDADAGPLAWFTIFFAAAPLVGLGLLFSGAARRWFAEPPPT
jgi:hypothetical protein